MREEERRHEGTSHCSAVIVFVVVFVGVVVIVVVVRDAARFDFIEYL